MNLVSATTYALLHFVLVHPHDATEPDRIGRMTINGAGIVQTVNRATCSEEFHTPACRAIYRDRVELLAILIVQADHEAGWRYEIQVGNCGPHECDPFKRNGQLLHAAKGLWQGHRNGLDPDFWAGFEGLEQWNVERASWDFSQRFAGHVHRCHGLEGGFSGLASGHECNWSGAAARAAETRRMTSLLRVLLAKPEPEFTNG